VSVRTAVVVPGHGGRRVMGCRRISRTCLAVVREAERVARETPVDAVVFTGASRGGVASEAEQMRAAWRGPDVELVVEPTALVTAENAVRSLPLLLERGIQRAIVVVAPLHVHRARYFFSQLYEPRGIETVFRVAPVRRAPGALGWELGAALVRGRQLRAAEAELAERR
jgi:uncharacterized SAM-binding protein YcdF (DUF218 family)